MKSLHQACNYRCLALMYSGYDLSKRAQGTMCTGLSRHVDPQICLRSQPLPAVAVVKCNYIFLIAWTTRHERVLSLNDVSFPCRILLEQCRPGLPLRVQQCQCPSPGLSHWLAAAATAQHAALSPQSVRVSLTVEQSRKYSTFIDASNACFNKEQIYIHPNIKQW